MTQRTIKFRVWDGHTKSFFDASGTHYLPKLNVDQDGILTFVFKDDTYKVMQFTGLTDKNGKEIYEGDIMKHYAGSPAIPNGVISVVKYGKLGVFFAGYNTAGGDWTEVIGNIYENPELIKQS